MKKLFTMLCLIVLGTGTSAFAQDVEVIEIKAKPLAVGTVINRAMEGKMNMDQDVSMDGNVVRSMKIKGSMNSKTRWTVLASDDKGVSKAKVHVIERKETMEVEGAPEGMGGENEDSPTSGNTYVITRGADGVQITAEGDVEVTRDMEREIRNWIHDEAGTLISSSNGLEKLVSRGKFTVGSEVTLGRGDLEKFVGGDNSEFPIESMTFKPTGSRNVWGADCAVFDVVAKVAPEEGSEQGPPMTAEFTGEAILRKDGGWMQSCKLSGPINVDATEDHEGMSIEIKATGNMQMNLHVLFEAKKQ